MATTKLTSAPKRVRTAVIHVRTTPDLKAAVDEAAERDRRSLAAVVELALEAWLRQQQGIAA